MVVIYINFTTGIFRSPRYNGVVNPPKHGNVTRRTSFSIADPDLVVITYHTTFYTIWVLQDHDY